MVSFTCCIIDAGDVFAGSQANTLRELYTLAASQQPLASLVSQQQQRLLELSRFRHYDLLSHQQGAVTKLLGESTVVVSQQCVCLTA